MSKGLQILELAKIFKCFTTKQLWYRYIYIFTIMLFLGLFSSSCKTKEGCAINDNAHVKMNKKGKKKGKTKSNLFSKKVRKRL